MEYGILARRIVEVESRMDTMAARLETSFAALTSQIVQSHRETREAITAIVETQVGLRAEIASLADTLRGEMAAMAQTLRGEMAAGDERLGRELRGEMGVLANTLRGEMAAMHDGLHEEMHALHRITTNQIARLEISVRKAAK